MREVSSSEGALPAAWALVSSSCLSFGIIIVLFFIADNLSRKKATMLSLLLGATASASFALGSTHTAHRPWFLDVLYYYGMYVQSAASTLGYMVIYQIAADIYPTEAAAIRSAFVVGTGRIGALAAPLIVENILWATGDWTW